MEGTDDVYDKLDRALSLAERALQTVVNFQERFKKFADCMLDGVPTKRLTIVNDAGQPLLTLRADEAGGRIDLQGRDGVVRGSLYIDSKEGGSLVLADAEGKLRVGISSQHGAGRMDLYKDDGAVSFGPR